MSIRYFFFKWSSPIAAWAMLSTAQAAVMTVQECEDKLPGTTDSQLGYEEIVPGKFYVVYSGISKPNNQGVMAVFNTSNIYLIKGRVANSKTDRLPVWVFGSGYGDPNGDVEYYRASINADATRNAAVDACYINSVIRDKFSWRNPARIDIRFLTPHYHLDHVNQEIFSELWLQNYPVTNAKLYVHAADAFGIDQTCTTPCCMTAQEIADGLCTEVGRNRSPNWGKAYTSPWQSDLIANKIALGSESDAECAQVSVASGDLNQLASFVSAMGTWTIHRGMLGHTDGPLTLKLIQPNSNNTSYMIRGGDLQPGDTDRCDTDMPSGTTVYLPSHDNIVLTPQ